MCQLARRLITTHTKPGDLVIDPTCGSGDFLVEAIKANRIAIGIEPDKHLADIARRRIEMATATSQKSGYGAAVHGNPLHIAELLGREIQQRAALVVVSPQYADEELTVILNQCLGLLRPDGRLIVFNHNQDTATRVH